MLIIHRPIFSAEMPLFFLACPMKSLWLNLSFPLTQGAVMISATFIVILRSVVEAIRAKAGAENLCRAVLPVLRTVENKHRGHSTFCQIFNKPRKGPTAPWFRTDVSTPQPWPRGHSSLAMSRAQPPRMTGHQ